MGALGAHPVSLAQIGLIHVISAMAAEVYVDRENHREPTGWISA
jgi:hypothetical protein